jgi:membrane-bound lytic murein transglycosylase MltF
MKEWKKIIIFFAIWILLLLGAWGLHQFIRVKQPNVCSDFQTIQQRGIIRAGILQNTPDYYVDNGTVKGFHYELVKLFANRYSLKAQYIVYETYWDGYYALVTGKVDVLAMDLNSNFQNKIIQDNLSLQTQFNHWLDSLKQERHYNILRAKYYSPASKNRRTRKLHTHKTISVYDDRIKKCAKIYHIDWRLISALIYQESNFNPNVTGKGGSFGLMQLMPNTATHLGMKPPYSVEQQIVYGCKYLYILKKRYAEKGVDPADLYKFVLAAYNAGACHIDDAILLAKEKNYKPNQWKDVEKMLLKLSDKEYTQNVRLKCGNYNGKYAKNYVSNIWNTYQHYQNMSE